jgi:hypothetical protein
VNRLAFAILLIVHFRAEWTSLTNNTIHVDVAIVLLKIPTWESLADVSREWTTGLISLIIRVCACVMEVVIPIGIFTEFWAIFFGCYINRCTCTIELLSLMEV